MASHAGLLETYLRYRETGRRLNSALMKALPKDAILICGKRLGILEGNKLILGSEDEMAVLMDYALYDYRVDGRNTIERYLAESPPPPGTDERVVLEAMARSRYSLFQVAGVERGVGVEVVDALRGDAGFLVDIGLGQSGSKAIPLAMRVMTASDLLMTTGAAIPLDVKTLALIIEEIMEEFDPEEMDITHFTPARQSELTTLIIRTCLSTGVSSRVSYRDVTKEQKRRPPTAPKRRPPTTPRKRRKK